MLSVTRFGTKDVFPVDTFLDPRFRIRKVDRILELLFAYRFSNITFVQLSFIVKYLFFVTEHFQQITITTLFLKGMQLRNIHHLLLLIIVVFNLYRLHVIVGVLKISSLWYL